MTDPGLIHRGERREHGGADTVPDGRLTRREETPEPEHGFAEDPAGRRRDEKIVRRRLGVPLADVLPDDR